MKKNKSSDFKSITKEDKLKFINPFTIDSLFLRILSVGFALIVLVFFVLYWTWDTSMIRLISTMLLVEFLYLFVSFIILSLELKFILKNTNIPNKIILAKDDMNKVLNYRQSNLYYKLPTNINTNDSNTNDSE